LRQFAVWVYPAKPPHMVTLRKSRKRANRGQLMVIRYGRKTLFVTAAEYARFKQAGME
jgi:hypothetical protein